MNQLPYANDVNNKLDNIKDLNRIWIRNLSRDDRAISDNGKEVRYPFLDKEVIETVKNNDFRMLTDFYKEKGKGGDKVLLRLVAS